MGNRKRKKVENVKKKPKNAYMFYLSEKRSEVREELEVEYKLGKVNAREVVRKVAAMWKELDKKSRAPYIKMANEAKAANTTDAPPKKKKKQLTLTKKKKKSTR